MFSVHVQWYASYLWQAAGIPNAPAEGTVRTRVWVDPDERLWNACVPTFWTEGVRHHQVMGSPVSACPRERQNLPASPKRPNQRETSILLPCFLTLDAITRPRNCLQPSRFDVVAALGTLAKTPLPDAF